MTSSDLLELPAFRARIPRMTVEQYHQQPERSPRGRPIELIRGYVFEKMSKSPLHASVFQALSEMLIQLPPGFTLRHENPLTFAAADSEPEPDLAIVRGTRLDFCKAHPTVAALVIEIAVTTLAEDRALAALYAEVGIEEYWIVIPRERQIEVYRQPRDGQFAERLVVKGEATLVCASVPGVRVALADLFAGI